MPLPDRTSELSFGEVNSDCADTLFYNKIVVVKGQLPLESEAGVAAAYHAARKKMLHRRIPSRILEEAGLGKNRLYRKIQAKDVKANPYELPEHMQSAQQAVEALLGVHGLFAVDEKIRAFYHDANLSQNLALFALSLSNIAFGPHQDNQGKAGLAEAAQFKPTVWTVHQLGPAAPAPAAYTFRTEPGDIVVLKERQGPCPTEAPIFRTGEHTFMPDGSAIHSGLNITGEPRYGLGLFNEQIEERVA